MKLDLSKLVEIKPRLNKLIDILTKELLDKEKEINSMNIGLVTFINMEPNKETNKDFGYAKIDGKWGLCVRFKGAKPEDERLVAIAHTSMHDRITVRDLIPQLIDKMARNAEKTVAKLEKDLGLEPGNY